MFKITVASKSYESIELRVEGRLVRGWVDELLSACRDHGRVAVRVVLNVAGLSFADADGIEALRHLSDQGVQFTDASPFIIEQMREIRP
jgi:hypothetical protein